MVKDIVPVKGNGMALGYTNGTANFGYLSSASVTTSGQSEPAYGSNVGAFKSWGGLNPGDGVVIGLTTDSTKSGIIGDLSNNHAVYIRTMIQLATQTTDEAIATMTQMRAELDSLKALPRIVDRQPTATGFYTVYSDGYYEECGKIVVTGIGIAS